MLGRWYVTDNSSCVSNPARMGIHARDEQSKIQQMHGWEMFHHCPVTHPISKQPRPRPRLFTSSDIS